MANKRLKKLTALLLSIVMVFSMVTEAFPAAFAAEEGGVSTPTTQADAKNLDFGASSATRRPGLYVDFLGDNLKYQPTTGDSADIANERDTTLVTGGVLGSLTAPGLINQSKVTNEKTDTNPKGTVNQWEGYKEGETTTGDSTGTSLYNGNSTFWVGVGDRKSVV